MNHLILWKDITLFLGSNPRAISNHQHPILQFILGIDEPFVWKNPVGAWEEKRTLLVAPNQQHECDAKGKRIMNLGIDPESDLGGWILQQYLTQNALIEFPAKDLARFNLMEFNKSIESQKWPNAYQLIKGLFDFKKQSLELPQKDERIQKILQFISQHIHTPIDTHTLMEVAHLSESRMLHLFKQEMGLPIRNYILWYRLQIALRYAMKGGSLTEAAHTAGFADQAHMTRTCVRTMGLPPSVILKNSKFVQVSFPE